jgi:23S rRNA G2069 N7-methylase RlmK/C1962 C5-methylase RlmI
MKSGGKIYFSTNYRRFKFEADQLQVENVREISSKTVPDDFRNQRIHRCWLIQVP